MENADRRIWSVDDILSSPNPMKLSPRGNHLPHGPLLPRVNQIAVPLATSHSGNCYIDLPQSPSLLARPVGSRFPQPLSKPVKSNYGPMKLSPRLKPHEVAVQRVPLAASVRKNCFKAKHSCFEFLGINSQHLLK